MIPWNREPSRVMQTITEGEHANCMRAALASYWSCGIVDTPQLADEYHWVDELRAWAARRGYGFVTIAVPNETVFRESFSAGYLIVSGLSKRRRLHAVIYKDGKLWHDPHPDSTGILKVESVDFFYPLAPPFVFYPGMVDEAA